MLGVTTSYFLGDPFNSLFMAFSLSRLSIFPPLFIGWCFLGLGIAFMALSL